MMRIEDLFKYQKNVLSEIKLYCPHNIVNLKYDFGDDKSIIKEIKNNSSITKEIKDKSSITKDDMTHSIRKQENILLF